MNLLTEYLKTQECSKTSIASYCYMTEKFIEWAAEEDIDSEYTSHADLLQYIGYLRKRRLSQSTIQNYLRGISHYFESLVKAEIITHNPANYITIKSKPKSTLHQILSKTQLENLYTNFEIKSHKKTKVTAHLSATRNKIAIGLMVFQGLDITSLSRLKTSDMNLVNGTVHIAAHRTSASRILTLQGVQIIAIDRYLSETRKELQQHFEKEESLSAEAGELLLITGYNQYTDANKRLMQRLRKQESAFQSATQIRASVITHWLKTYNLREVQYMAGHKRIHSTEAYQRNDIEGLQLDIDQFHPMNE